jgi:hypothetical protein
MTLFKVNLGLLTIRAQWHAEVYGAIPGATPQTAPYKVSATR